MDLLGIGATLARKPRNLFGWGALGLVAGITALDVITARGLDQTTGRMLPNKQQKA